MLSPTNPPSSNPVTMANNYYAATDLSCVLAAFARCDAETRVLSFERASQVHPNYSAMYVKHCNQNRQWGRTKNDDEGRRRSLGCIRQAEANADAAGGQVLDPALEGKRLVTLADGITAVPSLASDVYAFVREATGELVQPTEELLNQLQTALGTNAPAGGANGGGANGASGENADGEDADGEDADADADADGDAGGAAGGAGNLANMPDLVEQDGGDDDGDEEDDEEEDGQENNGEENDDDAGIDEDIGGGDQEGDNLALDDDDDDDDDE